MDNTSNSIMAENTKNRGAALITALFIMALVTIAAVAMSNLVRIGIVRTGEILTSNQASLYAEGVVAWGKSVLILDVKNQKEDEPIDRLPEKLPKAFVPGVNIVGTLSDAQRLFNVNNLLFPQIYEKGFINLLLNDGSGLSKSQATRIAANIIAWLKSATNISPADEEQVYLKEKPPYRAAHRQITSVSELRLVDGISDAIYVKLAEYLTALPVDKKGTPINVNTSSAQVLTSLAPDMTLADAEKIVSFRQQVSRFKSVDQFMSYKIASKYGINKALVTLNSHYFFVNANVGMQDQTLDLTSLLKREINEKNKSDAKVTTLWQSFGGL